MEAELKKQLASKDPRERGLAIKTLAVSGDPHNIQILKVIHENDPDPRVKEYARKAALHLRECLENSHDRSSRPLPSRDRLETQHYAEAVNLEIRSKKPQGKTSRVDREQAEKKVQRAFNLHASGQTQKAVKLFTEALEQYPGLEGQTFSANLAMELTGLTEKEAFNRLLDRKLEPIDVDSASSPPVGKSSKRRVKPLSVVLLILALAALVVAVIYLL